MGNLYSSLFKDISTWKGNVNVSCIFLRMHYVQVKVEDKVIVHKREISQPSNETFFLK